MRRRAGARNSSGALQLWVLAVVNRWWARQGVAVRAGLVAPAISTRRALADCAFAIALKTQRSHALADRGEIVSGAGCVRRHVTRIITLARQIVVRAARLAMR